MRHAPALGARVRGYETRADAYRDAARDVARVVNAGMHARVGNSARKRNEHRRQQRQLDARAGSEGERRRGVTGWERCRARNWDQRRSRGGAAPAHEQLGGPIGQACSEGDGAQAAPRGPAALPPAERGQSAGDEEPQPRVARRLRDGDERAVQDRRARAKGAAHQPTVDVVDAAPHPQRRLAGARGASSRSRSCHPMRVMKVRLRDGNLHRGGSRSTASDTRDAGPQLPDHS